MVTDVAQPDTAQSRRFSAHWLIGIAVLLLIVGAWLAWRYFGPVEVRLASTLHNLPFTVETIPPVVYARPGETVSVVYRIRNNDMTPIDATGSVEVEPASAGDQLKIFLTQCSGLNSYQNRIPQEYQVVFRVQAAGLTGAQQITLRHVFRRAGTR